MDQLDLSVNGKYVYFKAGNIDGLLLTQQLELSPTTYAIPLMVRSMFREQLTGVKFIWQTQWYVPVTRTRERLPSVARLVIYSNYGQLMLVPGRSGLMVSEP